MKAAHGRMTAEVEISPEISTTIVRIEISPILRTTDEKEIAIVIVNVTMNAHEIEIAKEIGNGTGIVIVIVTATEIEIVIANGIETELEIESEIGTAGNAIAMGEIETIGGEAKVEAMAGTVNREVTQMI